MSFDADAIIAEATKVAEPATASPEANSPKVEEPVKDTEKVETPVKPEVKPDSELTAEQLAKREANRVSHLKSKLAKLTRENREFKEREAQKAQAPATQPQTNQVPTGRPKEEDFTNYGDFLRADTKWEAQQEINRILSERDTKAQEATNTQAFTAQKVERINQVTQEAAEFAKVNPEYVALYKEHADYMQEIPDQVENALLEAENPNLALFALMKEGKLESLEDLSPYRIAMEIGKAELRGQGYLTQNKATNAPAPIEAARGTGTVSKADTDKSVEELMKKYNSR